MFKEYVDPVEQLGVLGFDRNGNRIRQVSEINGLEQQGAVGDGREDFLNFQFVPVDGKNLSVGQRLDGRIQVGYSFIIAAGKFSFA